MTQPTHGLDPNALEAAKIEWPPLVELARTLAFYASAIKSGETWSAECQRDYDRANKALQDLFAAFQKREQETVAWLADESIGGGITRDPIEAARWISRWPDRVTPLAALSQNPGTSNTSGEALRAHLRDHWLANIVCDHEAKTDTAICSCSQWADTPHPSVGAAVDAWIEHVFTTLPAALEPRASDREAATPQWPLSAHGVAVRWQQEMAKDGPDFSLPAAAFPDHRTGGGGTLVPSGRAQKCIRQDCDCLDRWNCSRAAIRKLSEVSHE